MQKRSGPTFSSFQPSSLLLGPSFWILTPFPHQARGPEKRGHLFTWNCAILSGLSQRFKNPEDIYSGSHDFALPWLVKCCITKAEKGLSFYFWQGNTTTNNVKQKGSSVLYVHFPDYASPAFSSLFPLRSLNPFGLFLSFRWPHSQRRKLLQLTQI